MKAISIRQPWAWLIVQGYKDIKNRTWAAKYRGPILIHRHRVVRSRGYIADTFLGSTRSSCTHKVTTDG